MSESVSPICRHRHRLRVKGERNATGLCETCTQARPAQLPPPDEARCPQGEATWLEVGDVPGSAPVLIERWRCIETRGHPKAEGSYPCAYGESTVPDHAGVDAD